MLSFYKLEDRVGSDPLPFAPFAFAYIFAQIIASILFVALYLQVIIIITQYNNCKVVLLHVHLQRCSRYKWDSPNFDPAF